LGANATRFDQKFPKTYISSKLYKFRETKAKLPVVQELAIIFPKGVAKDFE
jgi:GTP-sensing pleiotropic transcriptional regulator CodY